MRRRTSGRLAAVPALLIALLTVSCVSPEQRMPDPNAPILLYPAAGALSRLAPEGLLTPAGSTTSSSSSCPPFAGESVRRV